MKQNIETAWEAKKTIYRIWQLPHNNNQLFRDYKKENFDLRDRCCVWWDIWDDNLDVHTQLEEIFAKFNVNHPEHFAGHSLSVSDVVEVWETTSDVHRFYYCSRFGFTEV